MFPTSINFKTDTDSQVSYSTPALSSIVVDMSMTETQKEDELDSIKNMSNDLYSAFGNSITKTRIVNTVITSKQCVDCSWSVWGRRSLRVGGWKYAKLLLRHSLISALIASKAWTRNINVSTAIQIQTSCPTKMRITKTSFRCQSHWSQWRLLFALSIGLRY